MSKKKDKRTFGEQLRDTMAPESEIEHSDKLAEMEECECDECIRKFQEDADRFRDEEDHDEEMDERDDDDEDEHEHDMCPGCAANEEQALHNHMGTLTNILSTLRDTAIGLGNSPLMSNPTYKTQSESVVAKCLRGMNTLADALESWAKNTFDDDEEPGTEKEPEKKLQ